MSDLIVLRKPRFIFYLELLCNISNSSSELMLLRMPKHGGVKSLLLVIFVIKVA